MFIRYCGNGKKKYCQIVESYRDENGKPKHHILMSLGKVDENNIPTDVEKWTALAEQINIACGIIPKKDRKQKKLNKDQIEKEQN